MNTSKNFPPEVRERAVRLVLEQRDRRPAHWAAVTSIAGKIGCTPQTLLGWFKQAEVDAGTRDGVATAEARRVKELEREVKELRRTNEILKLASTFFAQAELDRRHVTAHSVAVATSTTTPCRGRQRPLQGRADPPQGAEVHGRRRAGDVGQLAQHPAPAQRHRLHSACRS